MLKHERYYYCFFIIVLTSCHGYEKGIALKFSKLSARQKDMLRIGCVETTLMGSYHHQHDDNESDLVAKSVERLLFDIKFERSERDRPLDVVNMLTVSSQTLHDEFEVERKDLLRQLTAVKEEIRDQRVLKNSLNEKLFRQKAELTDIIKRLNRAEYGNGLQELARKAEEKAMNYVFPSCKKTPYCLSSFENLLSFLSNPTSNEHTGPFAPDAWREIPTEIKEGILKRQLWMENNFGYIRVHIALYIMKLLISLLKLIRRI